TRKRDSMTRSIPIRRWWEISLENKKRFFHKKSSKNCPPGWNSVFDQTFVESLRVKTALPGGAGDILFRK
ncbi:MAG: hypothetical protein KAR25_01035, partial [Methanosarcinales archaeon]|nr:hypothetical protein [Methanosarcinales archaeon]